MVDQHRPVIIGATVKDPMSNRERGNAVLTPQPFSRHAQRRWYILDAFDRIGSIGQLLTRCTACAQTWTAADAVDLSLDQPEQPAFTIDLKDLEFDA